MEMHFATIWEAFADAIGERDAIAQGDVCRTWAEYEDRAARLAAAFTAAGLKPNSKIGMYLYNGNEYCETQFAGFKMRGVPVNVNYRYLDDELYYLLDNSDAEALVFHSSLGERVARVLDRLPNLKLVIEVDDGGPHLEAAQRFEEVISAHEPMPRIVRALADIYMLYTGGTTGMPKGVMYEMGPMTEAFTQALPLMGMEPPDTVDKLPVIAKQMHDNGMGMISIPACPMMHGTGMWVGTMIPQMLGSKVISLQNRSFDAHELWQTVEREKANVITIVGDAFARPMLRALEEAKAKGQPYDVSSIKLMLSSGVMWTREIKQALLEWGDFTLYDAMGSTEGSMGAQVTTRETDVQTAKFTIGENTKVFTEDGREVQPGSGEMGMVAAGGNVPIGYYKDPDKSARTFRTVKGVRYSFPGDWAKIEADGTLVLLGRGSQCINTGGEKVYPEEVEEALKSHPFVQDCLVVGVKDEKFGERVTAVLAFEPGHEAGQDDLLAHVRTKLAGYKAPKQIHVVPKVQRAPNGKADYKWAKQTAQELAKA